MKNTTVIHADMNDILFDDRNKAYGAYQIRQEYPRTIMSAFYITFIAALGLMLLFYYFRVRPEVAGDANDGLVNLYEVNIDRALPKPPVKEAALPLAAEKTEPAPKPKGMDTREAKVPTPSPEVDPNATIAADSVFKDKQPGTTNTDSSGSKFLGGDPKGPEKGPENPCLDCKPGTGDGPAKTAAAEPDPFKPFLGEMPIPDNMGAIRKRIGYPADAREAQMEGKVTYRVLVDEKGNYVRHLVLRSSHPLFDKACARHLADLKFTPGKMGDRPVACWVVLPFNFTLLR